MNKIVLATVTVAALISGCDFPLGEEPIRLESLHGKVIVEVKERFERYDQPSNPALAIVLRSEHIYGCVNYHIDYLYQRTGTVLDLSIKGASIGPVCLTALGPATATFFPGLSSGTYQLHVTMDGRTDKYVLAISESAICLTPRNTAVSRPGARLVWRYPPQSFAYYCGTLTQDAWLCDAFRDSLHKYLPLQEIQPPTTGEWPYPLASQGHYFDSPARFYRYVSEADFDSAGALLRAFTYAHLKNRSGVGLSLRNWRNAYFYSWLF